MRRAVALLATWLLAVAIGLVGADVTAAAQPVLPPTAHSYDTVLAPAVLTDIDVERGPPSASCGDTTYNAADRWPSGASVRSGDTATPAIYTYDDPARFVRSARGSRDIEGTSSGPVAGACLDQRLRVAAKSESRLISNVEHLPCNCFVAGTKVNTASGEKPIENIKVADKVRARDLETGKNQPRTVTGLFDKHADQVMTITVTDGAKVTVTQEHPFYVAGVGWVMSGDLKVGDRLAQRDGGSTAITAIDVRDADVTVYNSTVDGDHNYYVTEAQLLVHNWTGAP